MGSEDRGQKSEHAHQAIGITGWDVALRQLDDVATVHRTIKARPAMDGNGAIFKPKQQVEQSHPNEHHTKPHG